MFPRHVRRGASLIVAALLSGCASLLYPDDCRFTDWEAIGMRDGLKGESIRALEPLVEQCIRDVLRIKEATYKRGRLRGLESYCSNTNAIDLGARGEPYRGVCPFWAEQNFKKLYDASTRVHYLRQDVVAIEGQIESLKGQTLEEVQQPRNDDSTQRARDNTELDHLKKNLESAWIKLRDAEVVLDQLQDQLRQDQLR